MPGDEDVVLLPEADWRQLHLPVDPLVCPDCGGRLEIIAFIDAPQTIRRVLEHLELWALPARPPPAALLQGKIDAVTARSSGNRPGPSEHADGVFVDDVPVYAG